jgi:hypothetical protein
MNEGQPTPPTPQSDLVPRVGTFLFLLGIFSLIFFIASDFARQPDFDWLFAGMVLLGFGFLLQRRAPPVAPTGRFGIIRRMREEAKKRKEERAKKAKRK